MVDRPDIMMAVPPDSGTGFSEQLFLQMIRQQTQVLERVDRSLERMATTAQEQGERLAKLEAVPASTVQAELKDVETRISQKLDDAQSTLALRLGQLERRNTEVDGVRKFIDWLRITAPWLAAMVLGGIAYFNKHS